MKRFSVIVPVYNIEDLIERCVDSVLNQTYQDFELIIVNDGSTDNSLKTINKYSSDERVKIVSQENKGLGGARNTGVEHAQGQYLYFLDGDDFLVNTALEELDRVIHNKAYDVIITDAYYVEESRTAKHYKRHMTMTRDFHGDVDLSVENVNRLILLNAASWNKIVNREYFQKYKFIFPEKMYYEDTLVSRQIILNAKSIYAIKKPLYCYYKRNGSIMRRKPSKDIFTVTDQLLNYVSDMGYSDRYKESVEAVAITNIAFIYIDGNYSYPNYSIGENNDAKQYILNKFPEWKNNSYLNEKAKNRIGVLIDGPEILNILRQRSIHFIGMSIPVSVKQVIRSLFC